MVCNEQPFETFTKGKDTPISKIDKVYLENYRKYLLHTNGYANKNYTLS